MCVAPPTTSVMRSRTLPATVNVPPIAIRGDRSRVEPGLELTPSGGRSHPTTSLTLDVPAPKDTRAIQDFRPPFRIAACGIGRERDAASWGRAR